MKLCFSGKNKDPAGSGFAHFQLAVGDPLSTQFAAEHQVGEYGGNAQRK